MLGGVCLFLTLTVLQALVAGANDLIAPLHLSLFAGGLYVGTAAFMLPFRAGFFALFAAGLACDANSGAPFGTHAFLFTTAHVFLYHFRDRLPHEETVGRVFIVLLCNLALFAALTLVSLRSPSLLSRAGYRFASDLVISQLVIAVIAPWFFSFQRQSLALVGAIRERRIA
jgi:rod shape-determining protein MreD